jgi:hypothetical protein
VVLCGREDAGVSALPHAGASVCTGCGAEIVHSLNRRERWFVGLSFVVVALLIGVVIWRSLEIAHGAPVLPPKSGRRIFCNRWVPGPSCSSVLRRKEICSSHPVIASSLLPILSASVVGQNRADQTSRRNTNLVAQAR